MTEDNNRKHAIIAAVCFVVHAIHSCVDSIQLASEYEFMSITVFDIAFWVILIGFAGALFWGKRNWAFVIVAGANILLSAYYIIRYVSLDNVLEFLAAGTLALVVFITCVPAMVGKENIAKKIWFVPAVLLLLNYLTYWFKCWFKWEYFSSLSTSWRSIIMGFVYITAYLFTGMWLAKSPMAFSKLVIQKNKYETFKPETIGVFVQNTQVSGADKLKIYKDLLDTGVIDQDEFDQKKKEVLGL